MKSEATAQSSRYADLGQNYPSTFRPLNYAPVKAAGSHEQWAGKVVEDLFGPITADDYEQANGLWKVLGRTPGQQENFIKNVSGAIAGAVPEVRSATYEMFSKVNPALGGAIMKATEKIAA